MVWTPARCGAFLDSIEGHRLYALYHLASYFGLRRGELCGLIWSDVDLRTRQAHIRGDVKYRRVHAPPGRRESTFE
jgi:integrase